MTNDDSPFDDDDLSSELTPQTLSHGELLRAARQIGQRLDARTEELEDDEAALRWRRALLRLSETFLDAAEERRDLSPILLSALQNALEQLLIHGEENDLMTLEDWLSHESPFVETEAASTPGASESSDSISSVYSGTERRRGIPRRSETDRRSGERREISDRRKNL